ncbi:hypothetical protein PTKIN_Ptkin10aG0034500 [Pterospermum kingtungense]
MKIKPYTSDFKLAIEHLCIHAGGRAVLDELEKNLGQLHNSKDANGDSDSIDYATGQLHDSRDANGQLQNLRDYV